MVPDKLTLIWYVKNADSIFIYALKVINFAPRVF